MQERGPGDRAREVVGKRGEPKGETRNPKRGQCSNSPCGKGGGGEAEGGGGSERRAAAWSSGGVEEGEGEEGEAVGEAGGRKMRKRKRRTKTGGRRRKRVPWVVGLEVREEGGREEEGEVERGDEGRGLGERGLDERREVGRGVGVIFGCQVASEQPLALQDLTFQCDEEEECSHYSFSGSACLFPHPALLFFLPFLSFSPPLSQGVPSTLLSPSLLHSLRQMGGKK